MRLAIGCTIAFAIEFPIIVLYPLSQDAAMVLGFVLGGVCVLLVGIADYEWFE